MMEKQPIDFFLRVLASSQRARLTFFVWQNTTSTTSCVRLFSASMLHLVPNAKLPHVLFFRALSSRARTCYLVRGKGAFRGRGAPRAVQRGTKVVVSFISDTDITSKRQRICITYTTGPLYHCWCEAPEGMGMSQTFTYS